MLLRANPAWGGLFIFLSLRDSVDQLLADIHIWNKPPKTAWVSIYQDPFFKIVHLPQSFGAGP